MMEKKNTLLARGKFRHLRDLFVSCHLFPPNATYPLAETNTAHVYRKTWLAVRCRHFKVLLLHLCLCCSSTYFQFAVVLGKRFDS